MSFHPQRFASAALAVSLSSCAVPAAPDGGVRATTSAIIDGELEPGEDAVVLVLNRAGGLCSGSLISDRVVLTAKHCAQRSGAEAPYDPTLIIVGVGESRTRRSRDLAVESIFATPGTYLSPFGTVNATLIGTDVALLVLAEPVEGIDPLPISTEDVSQSIGEVVTAIGYGQTNTGQTGVKYRRETVINDVDDDGVISTARAACGGDSGSPLLLDGTVVGVLSFGPGNCVPNFGEDGYNRIDVPEIAELILGVVQDAGGCVDDGAERCDGFDNDCNGEIDEVCTPLGGTCTADEECRGTDCRDTVAGQVCTRSCDPLRPGLGCPPGLYCTSAGTGACEGVCVPGEPAATLLAYGEACDSDLACGTLRCVDPGDGRRRCLDPCQGGAGLCLAGEACAATPAGCGACLPADRVELPRNLGERCGNDDECASESCLAVDPDDPRSARFCSQDCDATFDPCPGGFHCRSGSCLPGFPETLGGPCVDNGDCDVGAVCATRDIESWCTFECGPDVACPEGYACAETDAEVAVCAPVTALLGQSCAVDTDCATNACEGGVCVEPCDRFEPCGVGFECRRDPTGDGGLCVEIGVGGGGSGGGCAAGPASPSAAVSSVLALLALVVARRRRR